MRVTGKVPLAAVLVAVMVSLEVPVMLEGVKVTPLGRPEAVRAMVPEKPFAGVTVTVLVPVLPAESVAAVAERLKSGVGATLALVNVNCDW